MNKKQKKMLIRILISAALLIALSFCAGSRGIARFVLYLVPYLIIGYDILLKAFKGIKNRQMFDENFFDGGCHGRSHCYCTL